MIEIQIDSRSVMDALQQPGRLNVVTIGSRGDGKAEGKLFVALSG